MSEWISVKERLPEEGERVLVAYPLVLNYPWVGIFWYGIPEMRKEPCFYSIDSEWGDCPRSGVTHWMPLPKSPEGDE